MWKKQMAFAIMDMFLTIIYPWKVDWVSTLLGGQLGVLLKGT